MKKEFPYGGILAGLTFIGAVLRFYNLGYNSLWLDEAVSINWSRPGFLEIWNIARTIDFHPPLFHWITHIVMMFGQTEPILRFIPALLGVLTIPLVYLLGKEMENNDVGIIAATFLTTSYFAIYYSQEAYSYSIVMFVFTAVLLMYFIAHRTNELRHWVLFGVLSAVAFWLHYYVILGIFVVYFHGFYISKIHKEFDKINNLFAALGTTILLSIPLLYILVDRYTALSHAAPTYGTLGYALAIQLFIWFSGFNLILAILFFILVLGGIAILFKYDRSKGIFAVLFVFLPILMSVIISSKITMNPRYLIYILPMYFILIATWYPWLVMKISDRLMNRLSGTVLLSMIIVTILVLNGALLVSGGYYTSYSKEDWRGVGQVLPLLTHTGNIVVNVPSYNAVPLDYYYSNITDQTLEYGADNKSQLEALKSNNTIYVITNDISAMDPSGNSLNWLYLNTKEITQRNGIVIARGL